MTVQKPLEDIEGKTIVVMGVANKNSIATGVANMVADLGARVILTGQTEELVEKRILPLTKDMEVAGIHVCDVNDPARLHEVFKSIRGPIHGLVHSIAFAETAELEGPHLTASTAAGFHTAMKTSAYSYFECARQVFPFMTEGGSLVGMSFDASARNWANYNDMAVAKAALERFSASIAAELGPLGIRSNIVSPGPMNTLSAAAITGKSIVRDVARSFCPDGKDTTPEEIASATIFLLSNASAAITGAVIPVNHGLDLWAHPTPWGIDDMEAATKKIRELIASGKYKPLHIKPG